MRRHTQTLTDLRLAFLATLAPLSENFPDLLNGQPASGRNIVVTESERLHVGDRVGNFLAGQPVELDAVLIVVARVRRLA
jgi:hypothetical protein